MDYICIFVVPENGGQVSGLSPVDRYVEAASELNVLAANVDKDKINNLFKEFIKEKSLQLNATDVRGDKPAVQGPSQSPVNLDNVNSFINMTKDNITKTQQGMSKPEEVPNNIREQIEKSSAQTPIQKPSETNPNVIKTKDNINKAGENMAPEPWGLLYPTPTAKDIASGKEPPSESHTLFGDFLNNIMVPSIIINEKMNKWLSEQPGYKFLEKKDAGNPFPDYKLTTPK